MDKLALVFFLLLILSSCAKVQFGNITNNTENKLAAKAIFINKYGEHALDFSLEPEGQQWWRYHAYPWETSTIQESFKKLQVSNKLGCTTEYDRKNIEAKATKTPKHRTCATKE